MSAAETQIDPEACAAALETLRDRAPLVQCLTNIVVAQWTANVLLAVGAAPAMVDNPEEAGPFAAIAGGVLINLGTPYTETVLAMERAVGAATEAGTPWVLDPAARVSSRWTHPRPPWRRRVRLPRCTAPSSRSVGRWII